MAAHTTTTYKKTLSGSVGAGMGSLFNPNGRKYYILEHKVSSKYHKVGESQEIIVDNIEIGRDSHCQVRYDESFKTVSRHHAAIIKDGDMWKLVQISKTNSTLLNGHPIKTEWYLQNGDEIQLSINGPKLGFIIPTGKKSTVGSIGLTRRLSLFRQQALRPYKTALTVLSCMLVLCVGGLVTWNYMLREDYLKQSKILASEIEANKSNQAKVDSLAGKLVENNMKMKDYEQKIIEMRKKVASAEKAAADAKAAITSVGTGGTEALRQCANNTYYCTFTLSFENNPLWTSSGTGFLLDDGRFITCQHVADFLYNVSNNPSAVELQANFLMNENPESFTVDFYAISPSGDKIQKQYRLNNSPFRMGSNKTRCVATFTMNSTQYPVRVREGKSCDDWAVLDYNKSGGLQYDASFSRSMPIKTHLDILGFPMGVGAENKNNISPIYSESSVAREGLDTDGCILLSNSETDHGNSGGPVFASHNGNLVVVGILSGANRLGSKTDPQRVTAETKWKGRVVPISNPQ